MAKHIKKVLFQQVGLFLGLAIIIAFSSIFGAILLRQVLAAPAGQGSIITGLTAGLADIKGAGFVKDTHSLKQIKDKSDDTYNLVNAKCGASGSGSVWVGYTTNKLGNLGGIIGANQKCNTSYSGSHACAYEEILKLGSNYQNSQDAWIIDGSYLTSDSINFLQCTRDGYNCRTATVDNNGLCRGWTSDDGGLNGPYLFRSSGVLQLASCNFASPLPCCK